MPRLRQMPELFLRGALANETMKNLTPLQKSEVERITRYVQGHVRLAPNRSEVTKQLGRTIGGDYREDRTTADQEFQIAIWRGVVHLLYHCSYSFRCINCNQTTYLTQRNKPSAMDRRYPVCPSCRSVQIVDAGSTDLAIGSNMGFDAYQNYILELPPGTIAPQCGSPIVPVPGEKKVQDAQVILDDPGQLHKFFSEFIWNYFRQILNENEITYHQKEPVRETGPADRMAVLEIVSLLGRLKTPHQYCTQSQPEAGQYHIYCHTASTPPEFTAEYIDIITRYAEYGVAVRHTDQEFVIPAIPTAPLVDALVVRPAPVLMSTTQSSIGGSGEESTSYAIEHLEYKNSGELSMQTMENNEILDVIRQSLPDGECQDTFDIYSERGPLWEKFSNEYGDAPPRAGHIAQFLGTTARAVAGHKSKIMIHCFSHGFVPGSVSRDED